MQSETCNMDDKDSGYGCTTMLLETLQYVFKIVN